MTAEKSIPLLLDDLSRRGLVLKEEGGAIAWRGPAGALTEADKTMLRRRKPELLAYLKARAAARRPLPQTPGGDRPSFYQEVWWHWFKDAPSLLPYERVRIERRFTGVSPDAVAAALVRLAARHDALRMRFDERADGLFLAWNAAADFPVCVQTGVPAAALPAMLETFFEDGPRLRDPWLVKARVFADDAGAVIAALAFHHTACDGGTYRILMADLDAESAAPGALPPSASLSYAGFAAAERHWFSGQGFEALTGYWADWTARMPLLHGPVQKKPLVWCAGERVCAHEILDGALSGRVTARAAAWQVSPFILLLTAACLGLARWSGQNRFAVRSVADGRTHPALAQTAGLILRHYPIGFDGEAGADAAALVKAVACEHDSGAALRFPTHWEPSGADFRGLHHRIAATLNYLAVEALPSTAPPPPIAWPAWLPPVQVRMLHAPDAIGLVFECNAAVLDAEEQRTLRAAMGQAIADLADGGR